MSVVAHGPVRPPTPVRPPVSAAEARRRRADLHLFTYTVGTALVWVLWAAISVSADRWYWWALVPVAAWTLVLALHLTHAHRLQSISLGRRLREHS